MSHETLSHYCNDINPKTLKEIKWKVHYSDLFQLPYLSLPSY
jgi:hypothetical protein